MFPQCDVNCRVLKPCMSSCTTIAEPCKDIFRMHEYLKAYSHWSGLVVEKTGEHNLASDLLSYSVTLSSKEQDLAYLALSSLLDYDCSDPDVFASTNVELCADGIFTEQLNDGNCTFAAINGFAALSMRYDQELFLYWLELDVSSQPCSQPLFVFIYCRLCVLMYHVQ